MNKRDHAKRAGELISSGIDTDLRYAALELRMAMEVIAYEKLRFYAARLPAAVLETWQPPQAIKLLLELEPEALYDKQFRIAEQHSEGSETGRVIFAGEHFSFKLPWLKKSYHSCAAEHEAEFDEEGNATFYPIAADFPCINCRATIQVQHNKVVIGREFACDSCKTVHRFVNTTWHYRIASAIDAGGA